MLYSFTQKKKKKIHVIFYFCALKRFSNLLKSLIVKVQLKKVNATFVKNLDFGRILSCLHGKFK